MLREISLGDVLTWSDWLVMAGLATVLMLTLYVMGQFIKILWRD